MNINATLIGQSVAFIIFVWFCMKFVWPPVIKALEERKKKIADGLEFARQADIKLADAKKEARACLKTAQEEAESIIKKANQRAVIIVDEAKEMAREEANRIRISSEQEIANEFLKAKTELRKQVASLAVSGASHIIGECLNEDENKKIIDRLVADF